MGVGDRHIVVCGILSPVGCGPIPSLNDVSVVGQLISHVGGEDVGRVGERNLREVRKCVGVHIHRIQGVVGRPLLCVATITAVYDAIVGTANGKVSSVVDGEEIEWTSVGVRQVNLATRQDLVVVHIQVLCCWELGPGGRAGRCVD